MTYYDVCAKWLEDYIKARSGASKEQIQDEIRYAVSKESSMARVWEDILNDTH